MVLDGSKQWVIAIPAKNQSAGTVSDRLILCISEKAQNPVYFVNNV